MGPKEAVQFSDPTLWNDDHRATDATSAEEFETPPGSAAVVLATKLPPGLITKNLALQTDLRPLIEADQVESEQPHWLELEVANAEVGERTHQ
ncbi:MAG: hypothetical protein ACREEC_12090 [Thermoplasmata archaeon]